MRAVDAGSARRDRVLSFVEAMYSSSYSVIRRPAPPQVVYTVVKVTKDKDGIDVNPFEQRQLPSLR